MSNAAERIESMNQILPMILSPDDSKAFLAALEPDYNPPHQLRDLKKHYDSMNITDGA